MPTISPKLAVPRSAADAIYFTPASLHVYSQPIAARPPRTSTFSSSQQPLKAPQSSPNTGSTPPPRKETPHEKVARLRAMRIAQRHVELPLWERTILRGRKIADRAHMITTASIILFSIISIGVLGFTVTDMLLHNRRKRDAFYEQQHRIYASKLLAAIETEKAGLPLTNDQQLVINRERLKIAADERKREQSWSATIKRTLIGGLKKTEEPRGELQDGSGMLLDEGRIPTEAEVLQLLGVDNLETLKEADGQSGETKGKGQGIPQDIEKGLEEEVKRGAVRKGGILDQMAENIVQRTTGT